MVSRRAPTNSVSTAGQSQGERFPFTFPVIGSPANANLNFAQYFPMSEFSYYYRNKLTYAEHYNFSIQRQLSASTVLTVAYVGTQGHHLLATLNSVQGSASLCQQLNAEGATPECGEGSETSTFTLPNGNQVYGTLLPVGNQALGLGPLNNQAIGADIPHRRLRAIGMAGRHRKFQLQRATG
jgi:hypothetical protein